MANRAARHGTSTSTVRHGTARHGTMRHGGSTVPCLIVPPCRDLGPGTALWAVSRAVPCCRARQPGVPLLARALQLHARSDLAVTVVAAVPVASRRRLIGGRHHWELRRAGEGRGSKREKGSPLFGSSNWRPGSERGGGGGGLPRRPASGAARERPPAVGLLGKRARKRSGWSLESERKRRGGCLCASER